MQQGLGHSGVALVSDHPLDGNREKLLDHDTVGPGLSVGLHGKNALG